MRLKDSRVRPGIMSILLVLSCLALAQAEGQNTARLSFLSGEVTFQKAGQGSWVPATFNQPILTGDRIRTAADSRAEILLANGSVVRLAENSTFAMSELKQKNNAQTTKGKLLVGKLWANVAKLAKRDQFGVESPTAVAAVRGTVYRLGVGEKGDTQIRVYDGTIEVRGRARSQVQGKVPQEKEAPQEVSGPGEVPGPHEVSMKEWVEIVKAQQQITIAPDGSYKKTGFDLAQDAQEEWVQWNKARDKVLGR